MMSRNLGDSSARMSHNRGDSLAAYAALHPGSRFEIFVVARGLNHELLRGMTTLPLLLILADMLFAVKSVPRHPQS